MGSFEGLAEVYAKARRGYPAEMRSHLVRAGALTTASTVVDLGTGTGQLASMAAVVAAKVIAIDPEPDMVRVGQAGTHECSEIRWALGSDRDILRLVDPPIDLVLIGNAFHHMEQATLLTDLDELVAAAGFVVICSSSVPVWLQDADWSRALREQLGAELGRPIGPGGVPDHDADTVALGQSRFNEVERWTLEQDHARSVDSIVGEVVSSASGAIDFDAAHRLGHALAPFLTNGLATEHVRTTALIASRPHGE